MCQFHTGSFDEIGKVSTYLVTDLLRIDRFNFPVLFHSVVHGAIYLAVPQAVVTTKNWSALTKWKALGWNWALLANAMPPKEIYSKLYTYFGGPLIEIWDQQWKATESYTVFLVRKLRSFKVTVALSQKPTTEDDKITNKVSIVWVAFLCISSNSPSWLKRNKHFLKVQHFNEDVHMSRSCCSLLWPLEQPVQQFESPYS